MKPTAVQSFGMRDAIRHIENHILSFWITMQNWAKKRLWRTKSGVAILSSFVFHILYFSPYASVLLMGKKQKFSTIQIATSIEEETNDLMQEILQLTQQMYNNRSIIIVLRWFASWLHLNFPNFLIFFSKAVLVLLPIFLCWHLHLVSSQCYIYINLLSCAKEVLKLIRSLIIDN